eukprot:g1281.t1
MAVRKSKNPVVATTAGAIAGGIEATVVWPTEYAKTLMQLDKAGGQRKYSGMLDVARQQIRANGPLALYSGLPAALLFAVPKAGIRFGAFSYFKDQFADADGKTSSLRTLGAGMCAGVIEATLVVTPQETIKTKLVENNASLVSGVRGILAKEGVAGLYQGLIPTILKQGSNQGIRFMVYSKYKQLVTGNEDGAGITPLQALVGGMTSGCISTLSNNPADMVKTRMQGFEAKQYSGFMDCVVKVYQNEGLLAFYKGVVPRLMRVVPGQGVIFMSYESISKAVSKVVES